MISVRFVTYSLLTGDRVESFFQGPSTQDILDQARCAEQLDVSDVVDLNSFIDLNLDSAAREGEVVYEITEVDAE